MIYFCIPSYNEAPTVGLLLWKIRQIFAASEREYQLLVGDDGSTDATSEVLQPYARVLPLTVIRKTERVGYARMCEELLLQAVERTDRPKRDCAILMHADFAHDPACIPDMLRRVDGGADLVVAEAAIEGDVSRSFRLVRRWAPMLLRRRIGVPGVHDVVSGLLAIRLITLRNMFRAAPPPLLKTEGWASRAELLGRAARHARRIETVPTVERIGLRQRERRETPWQTIREVWRQRSALSLPAQSTLAPLERDPELAS